MIGRTSIIFFGSFAGSIRLGDFLLSQYAIEVVGAALGKRGSAGETGGWGGVEWSGRCLWVVGGGGIPEVRGIPNLA